MEGWSWSWYFPNKDPLTDSDRKNWPLTDPDKVPVAGAQEPNLQFQVGDDFNDKSLFTPDRDYLIRPRSCKKGSKNVHAADLVGKHLLIFGLCIPVLRFSKVERLCLYLKHMCDDLALDGKFHDVEVVLVTQIEPNFASDDTDLALDAFNRFFDGFPTCLAVPFSDTAARHSLCQPLGLIHNNRSCAVVVNKLRKVTMTGDGYLLVRHGAQIYPNFTSEAITEVQHKWPRDGVGLPINEMLGLKPSDTLSCPCGGHDCRKQKVLVSDLEEKVVLLYVYSDGSQTGLILNVLEHLRSSTQFDYELVVVTCPSLGLYGEPLSQEVAPSKLLALNACGYLAPPFRHWVSTMLWENTKPDTVISVTEIHMDRLIAIEAKSSSVDRLALDLLLRQWPCGLDYLYPFSIKSFTNKFADNVGNLILKDVLTDAGVEHFIYQGNKEDGKVPISDVLGSKVILYFGYAEEGDCIEDLKEAFPDYKVIFACIGLDPGFNFNEFISERPWYAIPIEESLTARLYRKLFGSIQYSEFGVLFVYGSDGRLCSVQGEDLAFYEEGGCQLFSTEVDLRRDAALLFQELKSLDYIQRSFDNPEANYLLRKYDRDREVECKNQAGTGVLVVEQAGKGDLVDEQVRTVELVDDPAATGDLVDDPGVMRRLVHDEQARRGVLVNEQTKTRGGELKVYVRRKYRLQN